MKKIPYILLMVMLCALTACSDTDPNEPRELVRIYGLAKHGDAKVGNIRQMALKEAAMTLGAQAGLQWRAEQLDCLMKEQRMQLDKIYNFRSLLLEDHVAPPVLAEGRQALNLSTFDSVRTADTVYKIIRPPRFVTTAPNWREYLWLRYTKPEDPNVSMLPKNRDEAAYWNCFVKKGWEKGIDQANQIFIANLNRLNRDYMGMILYHRLYAQNMVTAPFVSKTELGVTGDEHEMRINDRALRIAETSRLNTKHDQWRTAVWPVKVSRLTRNQLELLPKSVDDLPGEGFVSKCNKCLSAKASTSTVAKVEPLISKRSAASVKFETKPVTIAMPAPISLKKPVAKRKPIIRQPRVAVRTPVTPSEPSYKPIRKSQPPQLAMPTPVKRQPIMAKSASVALPAPEPVRNAPIRRARITHSKRVQLPAARTIAKSPLEMGLYR